MDGLSAARRPARAARSVSSLIVVAVGGRSFVRQMQLGGATGRFVESEGAAGVLEGLLSDERFGLVLIEADLVGALPEDLYERAFLSRRPLVVAVGGGMNEVLRRRIRAVMGADVMMSKREQANA